MARPGADRASLAYIPLLSWRVNRTRPYTGGTLHRPHGKAMMSMNVKADELCADSDELAALDDSALLTWRAKARAELERLPPHSPGHAELAARYDLSTQEVDDRARSAWSAGAHRSQP